MDRRWTRTPAAREALQSLQSFQTFSANLPLINHSPLLRFAPRTNPDVPASGRASHLGGQAVTQPAQKRGEGTIPTAGADAAGHASAPEAAQYGAPDAARLAQSFAAHGSSAAGDARMLDIKDAQHGKEQLHMTTGSVGAQPSGGTLPSQMNPQGPSDGLDVPRSPAGLQPLHGKASDAAEASSVRAQQAHAASPAKVPTGASSSMDVLESPAGLQALHGIAAGIAEASPGMPQQAHAESPARMPAPRLGVGGGSTASPADLYSLYSFLAAAGVPSRIVPCPPLGCLLMLADVSASVGLEQAQAPAASQAAHGQGHVASDEPQMTSMAMGSVPPSEPTGMPSPDAVPGAVPSARGDERETPLLFPDVHVAAKSPQIKQSAAPNPDCNTTAGPSEATTISQEHAQALPGFLGRTPGGPQAFCSRNAGFSTTTSTSAHGGNEPLSAKNEPSDAASPMEAHTEAAAVAPAPKMSSLPGCIVVQPPSQLILPISTAFEGLTPSLMLHACRCVQAMGCEFLTLAIIDGDGTLSMTRVYPGLHAPDAGSAEEADPEAGPTAPDD